MAFIRRGKIKKKRTTGYKVVVVVGDDSTSNEVKSVEVSIPVVPGQPTPTPTTMTVPLKVVKENGNKRFVFKGLDFSDDAVNYSYTMTSVMKDANDNQVGDALTIPVEVEEPGEDQDTRVRSVRIIQRTETTFRLKVVVVNDPDNLVKQVHASFDDYEGPDPEPDDAFMLNNPKIKGDKKIFYTDALEFSDPKGAADEQYILIIDLIGEGKKSLGASYQSAVVEGLDEV
jgi:hypothetical protein